MFFFSMATMVTTMATTMRSCCALGILLGLMMPSIASAQALVASSVTPEVATATPYLKSPLKPTPASCPARPRWPSTKERDQLDPTFNRRRERVWFGPDARTRKPWTRGAWAPVDPDAPKLMIDPSPAAERARVERGARLKALDDAERDRAALAGRSPLLPAPPARGDQTGALWLPHERGAIVQDAVVRARFDVSKRLDATLLLRATVDKKTGRVVSGYGVQLRGWWVTLVRFSVAGAEEITTPQALYRLSKRESLEVVVTLLGDRIVAQVHDADNGVELVSLTARDGSAQRGELGLLVPDAEDNTPENGLTLLSHRDACDRRTVRSAPRRSRKPTPRRFVTLTSAQAARAGAPLLKTLRALEQRGQGAQATTTYETDSQGLERLFCKGALPNDVSVEIPWKYNDGDYLTYKKASPVQHARGFRVDLSFKNPRMVEELLRAYHARFPTLTRLVEIGRSHQGRPILALSIARGLKPNERRPSVLINGSHHGDEPISTEISLDAIEYILSRAGRDPQVNRWLDALEIWVVPQVNPDGAEAFLERSQVMGRKNARDTDRDGVIRGREGVDLNRNYPFRWGGLGEKGSKSNPVSSRYRGPSAASEPEVQALMSLVGQEVFASSISYHTGTVCVLAPYTIDGVSDPTPNEAWAIGEQITRALPRHPEGRRFRLRRKIYSVDGTDQDWMRATHGTVALLVEAVRRTPRDYCTRKRTVEANRPSWVTLLDRTVDGPLLAGEVVDEQGRPVRASIVLDGQLMQAGEAWHTRRRDGLFVRYILQSGPVTVRVERPGFATEARTIEVKPRGITRARIVVPSRPTVSQRGAQQQPAGVIAAPPKPLGGEDSSAAMQ